MEGDGAIRQRAQVAEQLGLGAVPVEDGVLEERRGAAQPVGEQVVGGVGEVLDAEGAEHGGEIVVGRGLVAGDADVVGVDAAANQACIIAPFILAGAMAPATSAGVVAQTLAEALAGMTYVQLVRPGAPVVFGSFASSMSMQTGAPTFGTPNRRSSSTPSLRSPDGWVCRSVRVALCVRRSCPTPRRPTSRWPR